MASTSTTQASKKLVEGTNLQNTAVQNASNQYVSDATKAAQTKANSYGDNPYKTFQQSEATTNAYNQWQNTLANRPSDYQSNYGDTINNLLNQIVNREEFSYDFNADPLYQNYKNQYTQQGKNAMKDTIAQASSMTGGYGNSYATTAGSQAYQTYLQQLNDKIPELYQQAMNKYQMDTDNLMNKYNAVGTQEDREFGQWNSKMGIWQNDRDYGLNAYNSLWNQDFQQNQFNYNAYNDDRNYYYNAYRDSVSDDNNAYNNAYTAAKDAQSYEYQMNRDAVSDDQWNQQFAYQKERDAISDQQWAAELALKRASALKSSSSSSSKSSSKSDNGGYKLTSGEKKTVKAAQDKSDYLEKILNNTYGVDGEYTTVAAAMNMMENGDLNQNEFNAIMKNFGIVDINSMSDDEIAEFEDDIRRWMNENGFGSGTYTQEQGSGVYTKYKK